MVGLADTPAQREQLLECSKYDAQVGAGLLAGSARIVVDTDLADLVTGLNEHLFEFLDDRSFVTMACVAVHPETGAMECVNTAVQAKRANNERAAAG